VAIEESEAERLNVPAIDVSTCVFEEKTFTVGVKMYLMMPREKIAFTSTSAGSTLKLLPGQSRSFTVPSILVPRKRKRKRKRKRFRDRIRPPEPTRM
jgi:hypothetical protein